MPKKISKFPATVSLIFLPLAFQQQQQKNCMRWYLLHQLATFNRSLTARQVNHRLEKIYHSDVCIKAFLICVNMYKVLTKKMVSSPEGKKRKKTHT